MSSYSIIRIKKLKSSKELSDSFNHNERIFDVLNADPERKKDNIELIDSFGIDYETLAKEAVSEMHIAGVEQNIRKDAVQGIEIFLGYSRDMEGKVDVDSWATKSLAFLDRKFNPESHTVKIEREDGTFNEMQVQNIKHCVVHRDESNTHIHAFVVPIAENGRLSAYQYTNGRTYLKELQSEYAREMEEFGLERGCEHSVATHQQTSEYYTHLLKAVEAKLPEPERGEEIEDYYDRANDCYVTQAVHFRDAEVRMQQKLVEQMSEKELAKDQLEDLTGVRDPSDDLISRLARELEEYSRLKRSLRYEQDREKAEMLEEEIASRIERSPFFEREIFDKEISR